MKRVGRNIDYQSKNIITKIRKTKKVKWHV